MSKERAVYPISLDYESINALDRIVNKLNISKADAIREAIRYYTDYIEGLEVIKIRDIPREEAKEEILRYLKEHDRAYSSDIADALRLDLDLVNSILEELWREDKVEPID